jgi:hypothetical protein
MSDPPINPHEVFHSALPARGIGVVIEGNYYDITEYRAE